MSTLVEHARRELERVEEDPWMIEGLVKVVQAFADMGHSGGSAGVAIPVLNQLLLRQPLSPITSDPADWIDRSVESGYPLWQNRRDTTAFSEDGGQTWKLLDNPGDVA
jgi:hypothetical protein